MDKSKLLSPKLALQVSKPPDTQQLLDKFLSLKDSEAFLTLPNDEVRQRYIDEKVEERVDLCAAIHVKQADALATLEWLPDRHESVVVQFENRPQFMGRKENSRFYFNSEETLFLIEKGSVICYQQKLQLSLQDAFDRMVRDPIEFERYMVYAHLLRLGYRVRRCKPNCNEKKSAGERIGDEAIETATQTVATQTATNAKRPVEQSDQHQPKRPKSIDSFAEQETSAFAQQIPLNRIPLDQLVQDLNRFRLGEESNFLKFIRFKRMAGSAAGEACDWPLLEREYSQSTETYQSKPAFVIDQETLEKLANGQPGNDSDEDWQTFRRDFLSDSPLIGLTECLTNEQLQQRLAAYGPQLDSDCEAAFWDDLLEVPMNLDANGDLSGDPMQVDRRNGKLLLNTSKTEKSSNQMESSLNDPGNRSLNEEKRPLERALNEKPENRPLERALNEKPENRPNNKEVERKTADDVSSLCDFDVYLPNKRQRIQDAPPDYYLKILHSARHLKFPFAEIVRLNGAVNDPRKLLFVHCQSNDLNFYQFTDVDLLNCQ